MDPIDGMDEGAGRFSRRVFLRNSAGIGLFALTVRLDPTMAAAVDRGATLVLQERTPDSVPIAPKPAQPILPLTLERHTDLVLLQMTFCGFEVDKASRPRALVATATPSDDVWVGVYVNFPPQAIAEGDYVSTSSGGSFDPTPVLSQVAGSSRLSFSMKKGTRIPLPTMKVQDLLDWSGWTLSVQPTAQAGSRSQDIRKPFFNECAVEAPLALILAPVTSTSSSHARFDNRTTPLTTNGVTDCWTTTLAGANSTETPLISAVWADDYGEDPTTEFGSTPQTDIIYGFYEAPPKIELPGRPSRSQRPRSTQRARSRLHG